MSTQKITVSLISCLILGELLWFPLTGCIFSVTFGAIVNRACCSNHVLVALGIVTGLEMPCEINMFGSWFILLNTFAFGWICVSNTTIHLVLFNIDFKRMHL